MDNLLKRFWFRKFLITILVVWMSLINISAQNTFFVKFPAVSGYDPAVFEDEKGCIIAKYDFGLTRLNPNGRILWQSKSKSLLNGNCIIDSQYYAFPSYATAVGGFAFQAIDYKGKTLWMEHEEITQTTRLRTIRDFILDSSRKQYIVAGGRGKYGDQKNIYYWIAGLDYRGHILWEREWRDSGASRFFIKILHNKKTGGYMLLTQDIDKLAKKELFSLDTTGKLIERHSFEPDICKDDRYDIYNLDAGEFCEFGDGFLGIIALSVNSNCTQRESGAYFYLYDHNGKIIERRKLTDENSVFRISLLPNGDILGIYFDSIYRIGVRVLNDKLVSKRQTIIKELPTIDNLVDINVIESVDGGYLGIASELTYPDDKYNVYVFKTDSFGNINPREEYKEKLEPMMLQPNPASNNVSISIPYYFGKITAEFYTLQGVLLFKKTSDSEDIYDISELSPGMYIIKASVEETGEKRTMRLVVK